MTIEKSIKTKKIGLGVSVVAPSLRSKLKTYKKRAGEIEVYLTQHPDEWPKFQNEYNTEVDSIFRDIMNFEKENCAIGRDDKVFKLKKIFIKRIREIFLKGPYNEWSYRKPYGYAGDFKIIDDIYQNDPPTTGFLRLFDNYMLMSAISVAARNRKEDFKMIIKKFITNRKGEKLRIMDLASGPGRELRELLSSDQGLFKNVTFDCYDQDDKALDYAKALLVGYSNINFIRENAVRIAFRRNIHQLIKAKYDFIYATGLFDYFSERVGIALVANLKRLLNHNGMLVISTMRDKYSNPSVHFMEWGADWNLVYRDDAEFMSIFLEAGFKKINLRVQYEQQGIMQYIIAVNN